jgi:hypothetical protein
MPLGPMRRSDVAPAACYRSDVGGPGRGARLNDGPYRPFDPLVRPPGQHHDDLADRRLRPDGAIRTSTKTISFTGCRFDLAQLADAEAAGAFARRLSLSETQSG